MASLKKRKFTNGSKWYVKYRDESGNWRCVVASSHKDVALQMMANIVKEVERRKAGLSDDFSRSAMKPIAVYMGDFSNHLSDSENTPEHNRDTLRSCERIIDDCGWQRITDINEAHVNGWLKKQRTNGLSVCRSNFHSQSVKSFARWLWLAKQNSVSCVECLVTTESRC